MILVLHLVCEQIVGAKKVSDIKDTLLSSILPDTDLYPKCPPDSNLKNDELAKVSIDLITHLFLYR